MIIFATIVGIIAGFALCLIVNPKIYKYLNGLQEGIDIIKEEIEKLELLSSSELLELLRELKNKQ